MPDYGPPGGPHPGHPQEPWPGSQPHDPDDQPTQEWVRPDSWDNGAPDSEYPRYLRSPHEPPSGEHQSGYARPQRYQPGHGARGPGRAGPLSGPVPDRSAGRRSRDPVLVLAAVLALVVLGSGGATLYLLGQGEEPEAAQPSAKPSPPPSGSAPGMTAKTPDSTPAPRSSTDARFVKVGQCVKNEGVGGQPRLVITRCTARTYQVLARFDGATTGENDAKAKCGKVAGYTDWFFFNSELDVLDFVLCLKLR